GVPILYGGRGLRFAWRALVGPRADAPVVSLVRLGSQLSGKPSPYAEGLRYFRAQSAGMLFAEGVKQGRVRDPEGGYVGAKRCAECHAEIAAAHDASPHGIRSKEFLDSDFAGSTQCLSC